MKSFEPRTADTIPDWNRITTGCSKIDKITRGGIPVNGITELVGCGGVGKTQICLQLALNTQLPQSLGGLNKSVIYITTDSVFPSQRLHELSQVWKKKAAIDFEDNILVQTITDYEKLRQCVFVVLPLLLKSKNIGLLVIDSIAGPFRGDGTDVNYTQRSHDFSAFAAALMNLSDKFNLAVVCVNQVSDNFDSGKTEPCLGLAWSNLVTTRFSIQKNWISSVREFQVEFAPDLPSGLAKFLITKDGLSDVD